MRRRLPVASRFWSPRDDSYGSISAAEFGDRHGRTCFNTGRQGTQPLRILLIDGMTIAIRVKRRARSTSVTDATVAGERPLLSLRGSLVRFFLRGWFWRPHTPAAGPPG
jgi:hypothetical protein